MAAICISRGLAPLIGGMGAWLPGIRADSNPGALDPAWGNDCRFPMAPAPLGRDAIWLHELEIFRIPLGPRHQLYQEICINNRQMKTLIQIHKEGKYFVAIDLITNVADQGFTEEEAISNLKKGLEEHYQILLELAPKGRKLSFLDIEVERFAQAPSSLG